MWREDRRPIGEDVRSQQSYQIEARRHPHHIGIYGEMDKRPALELEDALTGIAVGFVLVLGVLGVLAR